MLSSFRDEILRAELNLKGSVVTRTGQAITVSSATTGVRLALAAFFLGPGAYLFFSAYVRPGGPLIQTLALVACPLLVACGAVFALAQSEKSFSGSDRVVASAIQFLGLRAQESAQLPADAVVRLQSEWDFDPPAWDYNITIDSVPFANLTTSVYAEALALAQEMAEVLGLEIVDDTSLKSRGAQAPPLRGG